MTDDTRSTLLNRLQVCSLILETINEQTDILIILERAQNVVKQLHIIGKLLHEDESESQ